MIVLDYLLKTAAGELSEGEVASLVEAAEGALAELSSLDHLSDEEGLVASVDELLEGATQSVCCQFAGRVDEANVETATTLLEIALSSEFREYSKKCSYCFLCIDDLLIRASIYHLCLTSELIKVMCACTKPELVGHRPHFLLGLGGTGTRWDIISGTSFFT